MRNRKNTKKHVFLRKRKPKTTKTKNVYRGGVRPDYNELQLEREILRDLYIKYDSDALENNIIIKDTFTLLSPYSSYGLGDTLLTTFLTYFLSNGLSYNDNKQIINNLIERSIAEHDNTLINENVVVFSVKKLAMWGTRGNYNNEIRILLSSISPIQNQNLLLSLYKELASNLNFEGLTMLIEYGHLLSNDAYKKFKSHAETFLIPLYQNNEIVIINNILKIINPLTQRTLSVMHPAHIQGIQFPPDVVEELHNYNK